MSEIEDYMRAAIDAQREVAHLREELTQARGVLATVIDQSTIDTDAPDAEWQCRLCLGIDGHHVPPCAVQAAIRALSPAPSSAQDRARGGR